MPRVEHKGGLNMTFVGPVHRNLYLEMRQSCAASDVSRYGEYRTAVLRGTNAFDLRLHIFWEAHGYYFSRPPHHRRVAFLLLSLQKLDEC